MEQQVYARVVEGRIAEYPVYEIHIKNRAHPMDWYTPVIYLQKPTYDDRFESIREELQITGKHVVASYVVGQMSVDAILNKLFYPNGRHNIANPTEEIQPENITIATIDPFLLNKVAQKASVEVGETLDAFVKERNYDDVRSCVSYTNSSNPQFKAEADRVIVLRDQTYSALYAYLADVTAGTVPLPKSSQDFKQGLPALTWA
jgi:hypothetical protein